MVNRENSIENSRKRKTKKTEKNRRKIEKTGSNGKTGSGFQDVKLKQASYHGCPLFPDFIS
jgi:hypothetical protein